jgi:hypothetical protein
MGIRAEVRDSVALEEAAGLEGLILGLVLDALQGDGRRDVARELDRASISGMTRWLR